MRIKVLAMQVLAVTAPTSGPQWWRLWGKRILKI
ncbi:hypothetical protein BofuT4_uP010480.1 [Botrytis cinerea T4]|uniref:Uncharacterized protein n=1 Tax=Botryotinia fuckeliana (strain T4) TaxID=999810 RepID=G2XT86_BOTF4|nr:hypothetical protein BofuT4_uP010480.1 [Botrytis cinerea T4]